MSDFQPTDAELYDAFVHPKVSRGQVASLNLDDATRMVEYRRRKASPQMRDLPLSDQQIARAILKHAQALHPTAGGATMTERQIMDAILAWQSSLHSEQLRQTRLLKSINLVVQIWGLFLILGIIGFCAWMLFAIAS